jgi:hypothetical protein
MQNPSGRARSVEERLLIVSDQKRKADGAARQARARDRVRQGLKLVRIYVAEDDAAAYVLGTGLLVASRGDNFCEVEEALGRFLNSLIIEFAQSNA